MSKTGAGTESDLPSSTRETANAMRLRPEPPRVTRISRRVLAGVGLFAGLGIGCALIYALQNADRQPGQEELFTTDRRQTADGLQGLPSDYSGIPQLGPPLPGDLGGPIVRAREKGRDVPADVVPVPQPDAEEQRRLAEMEAARTSEVFFQTNARAPSGLPSFQPTLGGSELSGSGAQDRKLAFLNAPVDRRTVAPDRVAAPASPFVLQAGSVIPAALTTGIRSDLPGQITAHVTQHVYDSPTGSLLLVPQGTRLIGEYDNAVAFGQRRVLLVWSRLIFPNGRSIVLERQPGADTQGYAGLEDGVDYHWWDLMKAAGLSTLLAVGAETTMDDEDRLIHAIRSGTQDTINDAGQQIVQRQLQVAPTLTIRPGFPVRVIVARDLVLEPYGAAQ
ncbi:MAG: TrbI/VirB10 family protein [Mesorhizobium sp.]|uniref:TrbI/VirB10 family protein n=3 Tax=unclassified Mesorhizobium TaxID=325217 RepID=UPI000FD53436|nr:TrbI/VirB10 family protein [Mesorhizobium sp. M5C.F.Ca.IN.020.32.2.1]RWG50765.1 MAG: TrbI/VirB10 family protein [Mesorhizobium sp.]RUV13945.1 TrbI/VirB10 family protein [Mesorhizobium sp. M5C.F.Ca.IN.020.32.2.1]RWI67774.1 MAG: TrbI/VirB10 family protein [Mesorhizobium sp.]RWI77730.1 MAG: TrbI/VirB10 family protein [Mesorhizobium sp.]RWJ02782.1 MAG: TrbI/VirB10 family protein [Mesorhizobium sp.]